MKSLKLLQIGDIHYPEAKAQSAEIDLKDSGMTSDFLSSCFTTSLEQSAKKAYDLKTKDRDIAAITLCGDLTSKGNADGYQRCVAYLKDALAIGDEEVWPHDAVHAVPGNHDVDQSKTDVTGTNSMAKFDAIVAAWQSCRPAILPIDGPRGTEVRSHNGCCATIISINSCLGCGEWRTRLLPKGVPEDLWERLKPIIAEEQLKNEDGLGFQRLDTPAFRQDDVDSVIKAIESVPETSIPIIVAHHNILPQALMRVALYTEVINGGMVRTRLSKCNRPVLYCHGHIHESPIEVLMPPEGDAGSNGRLICVSAPELKDGFNVIEIHYGHLQRPIGCTVHRWHRPSQVEISERQPPARMSLYDPSEAEENNLANDLIRKAVGVVGAGKTVRFPELIDNLRREAGRRHTQPAVADALLEAEWLGFVRIQARNKSSDCWHVRRVAP